MGEKSVQKKRYIVEKAREVFVEKGFKKVTMKDIVEACDISRGGKQIRETVEMLYDIIMNKDQYN